MKKIKNILLLIAVIIVGGVIGIKASTLISSSQVIYKDNQTIETTLDSLFQELSAGKDKIAEAITNKGVNTTSDNTLEEMANNINNISSASGNELELVYSYANAGINQTITLNETVSVVQAKYLVELVIFNQQSITLPNNITIVNDISKTISAAYMTVVFRKVSFYIEGTSIPLSASVYSNGGATPCGIYAEIYKMS